MQRVSYLSLGRTLILTWLLWCTGSGPRANTIPPGGSAEAAGAAARYEFSQVHMGLPVRLVLYATSEHRARSAAAAGFARIAALDRMMSDYRPESELRRLESRHGEWTPVSPELFDVLARAIAVARETEGAFDPTVGPLVALWREARRVGRLPSEEDRSAARARVGWQHLQMRATSSRDGSAQVRLRRPGMRLDLGGIAKGYILQQGLQVLRDRGHSRALLEAGGDIVAGDAPPGRSGWSVATPGAPPAFQARASSLVRAALATSGPTFQFVDIDGIRYSHVVDPRTGLGVTSPSIARVIAPDGATADALATALTILDRPRGYALAGRIPGVLASIENGAGVPPARDSDGYFADVRF